MSLSYYPQLRRLDLLSHSKTIKYYGSSKLKSNIHVVDSTRYALVDTFVNADQL